MIRCSGCGKLHRPEDSADWLLVGTIGRPGWAYACGRACARKIRRGVWRRNAVSYACLVLAAVLIWLSLGWKGC